MAYSAGASLARTGLGVAALIASAGAQVPWDTIPGGHMAFFPAGSCGSGETAYYAAVKPVEETDPNHMFIEVMGGSICFNAMSCTDEVFKSWLDIDEIMAGAGLKDPTLVGMLKSGTPLPFAAVSRFLQGAAGYIPFDKSHPLGTRRGIFFASCTADCSLGQREVWYNETVQKEVAPAGCNESIDNGVYMGCASKTRHGLECQKWSSQTPHEHPLEANGDNNYCRMVNGVLGCYTTYESIRWSPCEPLGDTPTEKMSVPAKHIGAKNMYDLLAQIQGQEPNLTHIAIYGGSGGGVGASAWANIVADMWPESQVAAFVDSGLHVMPGTSLYKYFWDNGAWGPGPAGQGEGLVDVPMMPNFDWRDPEALATEVASHNGRVKIGYLSCIDDDIVFSDRLKLGGYTGDIALFDQWSEYSLQRAETWEFLNTMHSCAPEGSVYSYIQNCSRHHQTRQEFHKTTDSYVNPGQIPPKLFFSNLMNGKTVDPNNTAKAQFWFDESKAKTVTCSSAVRRRRGVTDAPTPAPTPTPPPSVKMTMVVANVNFDTLKANATAHNNFKENVKVAVAKEAGAGIEKEHVDVVLSAGSVKVETTITPPASVKLADVQSTLSGSSTITAAVVTQLKTDPGLTAIASGDLTAEVTVAPASSDADADDNSTATEDTVSGAKPLGGHGVAGLTLAAAVASALSL
eukprot:TRINITY_DN4263_c0_g1_i1.p1 TRINITY_DN4263_c0_g1~~TRINITY_DN4263_c0_g1_i1.p1  ORF type:complete len:685 (+),score=146.46 TRINITY_DN4263_c0_g1_i1:88-2142(+)